MVSFPNREFKDTDVRYGTPAGQRPEYDGGTCRNEGKKRRNEVL